MYITYRKDISFIGRWLVSRWRSLSPFHLFTLDVSRLKLLGSINARVLNFWRDTRLINAALITEREILASSLAVSCFVHFFFFFFSFFFRLRYTSSFRLVLVCSKIWNIPVQVLWKYKRACRSTIVLAKTQCCKISLVFH